MKKGMLAIGVVRAVCCAAVSIGFGLSVAAAPPKNVTVTSVVPPVQHRRSPSLSRDSQRSFQFPPRKLQGADESLSWRRKRTSSLYLFCTWYPGF